MIFLKLWYLWEAKDLGLLDVVGLVDIVDSMGMGCDLYVHKNIMFNYIPYNGVDIYVYQTEDLSLIRNNKCFRFSGIPVLHVYGNTTKEGINYDWLIYGAWVDYIEEYLNKLEVFVDEKRMEIKIIETTERKNKEKNLKEKLKPFEIFFR